MKLSKDQEIKGKLSKVEFLENGQIKLRFLIQKEINLSTDASTIPKLQSFVGKNIGILKMDGEFFIRIIKG